MDENKSMQSHFKEAKWYPVQNQEPWLPSLSFPGRVLGWAHSSQVFMKCPEARVPISQFHCLEGSALFSCSGSQWHSLVMGFNTDQLSSGLLSPATQSCLLRLLALKCGEYWAGRDITTVLTNRLILRLGFHSLPTVRFLLGVFPQFLKELGQGTWGAFPSAWVREYLRCSTQCLTKGNSSLLIVNYCARTELEHLMPFLTWGESFHLGYYLEIRESLSPLELPLLLTCPNTGASTH